METKEWWKSRTIWAALVAALSGLLSIFGKELDPVFQTQIVDLLLNAITVIGGFVAAWGRTQATAAIGKPV
jgi:uncharacterized membrane protein